MLSPGRLVIVCGLVAFAGCGGDPPPAGTVPPPPAAALGQTSGAAAVQAARLVTRTVTLTLLADTPSVHVPEITRITVAAGGFVEQATTTDGGAAELHLRIPAPELDASVSAIERLAEVKERRDTARDVTEEVTDVEARIASLEVVRDRLRSLVQAASSVQDVLAVERELARVQGEIDSMQARLDLVRSTVALAQVSVRVQRPVVLGPVSWVFVEAGKLLAKLFVLW